MPNGFMAKVYATLKEHNIETKDMSGDHAVKLYNELNGNRVVIKPTYDGTKVTWIMTAMEIKKSSEN